MTDRAAKVNLSSEFLPNTLCYILLGCIVVIGGSILWCNRSELWRKCRRLARSCRTEARALYEDPAKSTGNSIYIHVYTRSL